MQLQVLIAAVGQRATAWTQRDTGAAAGPPADLTQQYQGLHRRHLKKGQCSVMPGPQVRVGVFQCLVPRSEDVTLKPLVSRCICFGTYMNPRL